MPRGQLTDLVSWIGRENPLIDLDEVAVHAGLGGWEPAAAWGELVTRN